MTTAIIDSNKSALKCFASRAARCGLATVAVAVLGAGAVSSQAAPLSSSKARIRSVVKADPKTGRLIRTVVVSRQAASDPDVARSVEMPRVLSQSEHASLYDEAVAHATVPDIVAETAKKYAVDPLLVHSVIEVESAYRTNAVSPKGAQGLMQLMPATARRFGVRNSFDVRENVEGGVRYLKYLASLFPNDIRLAIAAYNAGEGAVWKYNNRVPPYRETEQYVVKVGTRYTKALEKAKKQQNEPKPPAPAVADTATKEERYAQLVTFIDQEGRLHLRTVPAQGAVDVQTP